MDNQTTWTRQPDQVVELAGPHSFRDYPVEQILIAMLDISDSPRVHGANAEHVRELARLSTQLPPILVHRPTMRVIDGSHRLRAAMLRGEHSISARLFDGSAWDAFVLAVRLNATHGLPLSRADRAAATVRFLRARPHWSDRAIAAVVGLSDKTVAAVRRRTTAGVSQSQLRVGRDGRLRPYKLADGHRRAGDVVAATPDSPVCEISPAAGISLATAPEVRERVLNGQDVIPRQRSDSLGLRHNVATQRQSSVSAVRKESVPLAERLHRLVNDPSLRHNQVGRMVLRLLGTNSIMDQESERLINGVPTHCAAATAEVAQRYADAWQHFASRLEQRARTVIR